MKNLKLWSGFWVMAACFVATPFLANHGRPMYDQPALFWAVFWFGISIGIATLISALNNIPPTNEP